MSRSAKYVIAALANPPAVIQGAVCNPEKARIGEEAWWQSGFHGIFRAMLIRSLPNYSGRGPRL